MYTWKTKGNPYEYKTWSTFPNIFVMFMLYAERGKKKGKKGTFVKDFLPLRL